MIILDCARQVSHITLARECTLSLHCEDAPGLGCELLRARFILMQTNGRNGWFSCA